MDRKIPAIVLSVLIMVTFGCDLLTSKPDTEATERTANVNRTRTAEASLPTATQPPTATTLPTETPTIPPTVTASPTLEMEPTLAINISEVVLTLEDLPAGFSEISPDEIGLTEEDLTIDEDLQIENVFLFLEEENFEFVIGFTMLIPTKLERVGFDIALNDPDLILESFLEGMGASEFEEQEEIQGLDDIGDAAVGFSMLSDLEGLPMRFDLVVFRRDIVGAFLITMYLDEDEPVIPVESVASKLDARILELVPPGE